MKYNYRSYGQNLMENIIKKNVDFNCDLGQSFGLYKKDADFDLLDYMSSVNVSCGFHAGDPLTIKKVLEHCKNKNKVIGAHIGFPDLQGFGYRTLELKEEELEAIVIYQIGALASFAKSYGLEIEHVRPHGAMYKMASENLTFALTIAKAVKKFSNWLVYYGAAGSVIKDVAQELDINIAQEVQLDKNYLCDGAIDRSLGDFADTSRSIKRLEKLLADSQIYTVNKEFTKIEFDTVHFNNNAINSLELAKEAASIIIPKPVNYNKVEASGWV